MPVVAFTVRWPDGAVQECSSPSTVVHEHLAPGATFAVADFVARTATAMAAASERVRERYGFACTGAAEQQEAIARAAARYAADDGPVIVVSVGDRVAASEAAA